MARPQFTMNHLKFLMKGTGIEFLPSNQVVDFPSRKVEIREALSTMRLARQEVRGVTTTQGEKT